MLQKKKPKIKQLKKKEEIKKEKENSIDENFETKKERLSALSFSSYNSIDNFKLDKMGQYTCDKCSEIPKIISKDINDKTKLFKCREYGLKKVDIKDYLLNALNYNTKNSKCSQCEKVQRNDKDNNFLYCQCDSVFCSSCHKIHKDKEKHFMVIKVINII